jgi:hypothetical protein
LSALIPILILASGCQLRHRPNPHATIEDESEISSTLRMSDPRDAAQILDGFFGLESGAWRWSMKRFSVSLAPPKGAAQRGARLELTTTVPDAVAAELVGTTVTATIAGQRLAPARVKQSGEQIVTFEVPATALGVEAVIVAFELDRTIPRRQGETRDLGLIVSRIALVTP